jgi:hypothetical protein
LNSLPLMTETFATYLSDCNWIGPWCCICISNPCYVYTL